VVKNAFLDGPHGTYDYGIMGRGDYFVGDNGAMGQRPPVLWSRSTHYTPSFTDALRNIFVFYGKKASFVV